MLIKPIPLSQKTMAQAEANLDKKTCRQFGPCGVGEKALYLNSFFIDRRYYIPFGAIQRAYKRVAMSKGGYTGKGIFASMPYLVVEYDNGSEKQFNFKYEEHVDDLLKYLKQLHPEIKIYSASAEKKLAQAAAEKAALDAVPVPEHALETDAQLRRAIAFLDAKPELSEELSQSARRQRVQSISKPAWRWAALAIIVMGALSACYGAYELLTHQGNFSLYFVLFGIAAIFLFSGVSMAPTARNNKYYIRQRYEDAKEALADYLRTYDGTFPVPAYYAHPIVLHRMRRALRHNGAVTPEEALAVVKDQLKALNSSVQVTQEEYDEVIAIKAMFLNENYL